MDIQVLTVTFHRNMDYEIFTTVSRLGIQVNDYRGNVRKAKITYKLIFIVISGTIKAYLTPKEKSFKDFIREDRQYNLLLDAEMVGTSKALTNLPAKFNLLGIQVQWIHDKNGNSRVAYS